MASQAFLSLVADWEREHGRKATFDDMHRVLLDTLARLGVYPDKEGYIHRSDIERVSRELSRR